MKFRYERKFPGHISKIFNYYNFIYLNNFSNSYPTRQVNSIYFDKNFILANQNLDGVSEKTKVRLRWYDKKNESQLEFKIKKGFLNRKETYKFQINKNYSIDDLISESEKIFKRKSLFFLSPISMVSYKRDYFEHNYFRDLRLTIDKKINFSYFKSNNVIYRDNIVMELKYPPILDDKVIKMLKFSKFNLKLQKNSKYLQSLLFLKKNIF